MADLFDGLREAIGDIADSFEKMKTPTKTYGGTSIGDSAASAAGTGGRFRFPDVATAKKMQASFEDRRNNILKRETRIESAMRALRQQFAEDPESMGYSNVAVQSLQSLQTLNRSMHKYSDNYVRKLEKAIEAYEKQEDETSSSFRGGQARS